MKRSFITIIMGFVAISMAYSQTAKVVDTREFIADNGGNGGHSYEEWKVFLLSDGTIERVNVHLKKNYSARKIAIGDQISLEKVPAGLFTWKTQMLSRHGRSDVDRIEYPTDFDASKGGEEVVERMSFVKQSIHDDSDALLLKTNRRSIKLRLELVGVNVLWVLFLKPGDKVSAYKEDRGWMIGPMFSLKKGNNTASFFIL